MKNFLYLGKVPVLFSILCLALLALIAFQIHWLSTSRNLIQEQFDQKVNLAIGSALSEFNAQHPLSLKPAQVSGSSQSSFLNLVPGTSTWMSPDDQEELKGYLKEYMACYGIDEKYSVEIFNKNLESFTGSYCCAIRTGGGSACNSQYMLGVSFPATDAYLQDQMTPMIISAILVFLLLATVSFIILWALIKQKRITENNIDFFNNTAHELKTPLTNISLALKLMGMKNQGLAEDKYAQIIKGENSKLSDQIDRVLFLSKMENGEYALKKERLSVNEILEEVVEGMKLVMEERGAEIMMNLPASSPIILGDAYHLSNVFRNLIDNALKYSQENPRIDIRITEDDKHIKVLFRDNGIGISSHDQEHIFKKFQRVNTGNTRSAKGFGLGLSYVKTVIEMHKGMVQVESELSKGSEFQLLIPSV